MGSNSAEVVTPLIEALASAGAERILGKSLYRSGALPTSDRLSFVQIGMEGTGGER
jgi:hypothetical protein